MFQAHSYLIEAGTDSVLIDPGSEWNFRRSLDKITKVMPFERIRYFVCQHPDPDITASLPHIDSLVRRPEACVVSHWRSAQLLQHYNIDLPAWCVEAHDWALEAGGRKLEFLFTPYAHFPGAFATLDTTTGVLFSSDLFGGHTEGFSLVAEDESYFEALRPFHEHYMPSREVLFNAMAHIQEHDVKMIAPQHGSIIRGKLVRFMVEKLKNLECGLFLLTQRSTNIERLSLLNKVLRETIQAMIIYREFNSVAIELTRIMGAMIPVEALEFYALTHEEGVMNFAPSTRYHGTPCLPPAAVSRILGAPYPRQPFDQTDASTLVVALPPSDGEMVKFAVAIILSGKLVLDDFVTTMIRRMETPLQVAIERETIYRLLDLEKQKIYARSVRDSLTGCYNRIYMHDVLARQFEMQDRGYEASGTTAIMVDIDHFKAINDAYGHINGDEVLRSVGGLILENARGGDLAVRLGGEEFAIFMFAGTETGGAVLAERIRAGVEKLTFEAIMGDRRVTISAGIAVRRQHEDLKSFIGRVDGALYLAKHLGRNQVMIA